MPAFVELEDNYQNNKLYIILASIDFNLKNVDGNYLSLSDFTGKKCVIVIFTCNHCPYAKAYGK